MQISELFGAAFTRGLAGISDEDIAIWVGPIRSAYGWHAVKLLSRKPPATPLLADIRSKVVLDYIADKRRQANADYYQSVRNQYQIVIDPKPDFSDTKGDE